MPESEALGHASSAFSISLRIKNDHGESPLAQLEHGLDPWVAFSSCRFSLSPMLVPPCQGSAQRPFSQVFLFASLRP